MIIQKYISHIKNKSLPFSWESSLVKIAQERELALVICLSHKVYGFNTLPGHRDSESIENKEITNFQYDLIKSHNISSGLEYSSTTVKYFLFCKLMSIHQSGTGISPNAYESIFNMYINEEGMAHKESSYSCGDVIPAASLFKNVVNLSKGDAMSLINGNFIHIGVSLSLAEELDNMWVLYKHQTNELLNLVPIQKGILHNKSINLEAIGIIPKKYNVSVQDPVSIRALPDITYTVLNSIKSYFSEIERLINSPSGNPLFDFSEMEAVSQGSYMSTSLSLITSTLIDSILLLLWSIDSRVKYLLSGKVEGIARDNAKKGELGLIQYPKLITAKLELARKKFSSRVFTSGSSTSFGTEDLWSYGTGIAEELSAILDITNSILELEKEVLISIAEPKEKRPQTNLYEDIAQIHN